MVLDLPMQALSLSAEQCRLVSLQRYVRLLVHNMSETGNQLYMIVELAVEDQRLFEAESLRLGL